MAITYPLTLPSQSPSAVTIRMSNIVAVAVSEFTGQQEVQQHAGQFWLADVEYPPLQRPVAEPLIASLTSLSGRLGTFYLGAPLGTSPRGTVPGTPVVDGAVAVRASALPLRGFTASQTGVFLAGDYIQVGTGTTQRFYKVLADVNSDATGKATVDIWPSLREGLADGAVITTTNCKGVFRMLSNTVEISMVPGPFYHIAFAAGEAI